MTVYGSTGPGANHDHGFMVTLYRHGARGQWHSVSGPLAVTRIPRLPGTQVGRRLLREFQQRVWASEPQARRRLVEGCESHRHRAAVTVTGLKPPAPQQISHESEAAWLCHCPRRRWPVWRARTANKEKEGERRASERERAMKKERSKVGKLSE